MKRVSLFLAVAALGAITLSSAQAGPAHRRLHNQRARINEGVQSGELTKKEAHELRENEQGIAKERAEFKGNDGHIDPAERAKLHQDLNEQSRDIHRMKHNRRHRN